MPLIKVHPATRTNDRFINGSDINGTPATQDVCHPVVTQFGPSTCTRYQTDFYQKIALDVVVETVFNYPYPYFTEKTLRPIGNNRMFIILGPAGMLASLKSYGFVTFENYINESYDSIADPEKRFLEVMNAVDQFCTRSLTDIKQYLVDNAWRLEHNFKTLKQLSQHEAKKLQGML